MTGTELVVLPESTDVSEWTDREKAVADAAGLVYRHTYGERNGQVEVAPRAVIEKFRHTCARTGLDPLARQIYCIPRFSRGGVEWSIQTSIDGFRVIAERSQKYAGQDGAEWLTDAGEWVGVFIKAKHGDHPLAARVNIYRTDWMRPAVGLATWDEYAQTKRDGSLTDMWASRGPGQLAKCAEALGLRKAFPQDLSGIYTGDEMPRVDANADQPQNLTAARPETPIVDTRPEVPEDVVTAWADTVANLDSSEAARKLYQEARTSGALTILLPYDDGTIELGALIIEVGKALAKAEADGPIDDTGPAALSDEDVIDADVIDEVAEEQARAQQ